MDSLPPEILVRILKLCLDVDGGNLWNLRTVSRRWKDLVDYTIFKNPEKMYKHLAPIARRFIPGRGGGNYSAADYIHCWALIRKDLMHCIRSESRSVRVYDKEYKAVEDEDSGRVSKSILEGARQITLSHDSYFYIESSKRQEVRFRLENTIWKSVWINQMAAFGGRITVWRYHLGLIALGTANGKMFVYHVRSNEELSSIDLRRPLWHKNSGKWLRKCERVEEIRQTCKGQRVRFLFIMQYGNIWEFGLSLNNGEEGDGAEKMDRVADCEHVG